MNTEDERQIETTSPVLFLGSLLAGVLVYIGANAFNWALPHKALALLSLFVTILLLWVTEAIAISSTAILIGPALIALGIAPAKTVFAAYADPILFLCMGGLFLAQAMMKHRVDEYLANGILRARFNPLQQWFKHPQDFPLFLLYISTALISMWISNTATAAMFIPVAQRLQHAKKSVLTIAYAATIGGLGSLLGSPPNLITKRFIEETNIPFSFTDWMLFGIPLTCVLLVAAWLLISRLFPSPPVGNATNPFSVNAPQTLTRGRVITLAAFASAVVFWFTNIQAEVVALFACLPLFLLKDENKQPVLSWHEAQKIEWGIIYLFGGGIALGNALIQTGLADRLGAGLAYHFPVSNIWLFGFLVLGLSQLLTEFCSNAAAANILLPLVITLAGHLHLPVLPAIMAVGIGVSLGFALPVSTGPNALAYATKTMTQRDMIKTGIAFDLICTCLVLPIIMLICHFFFS